MAFFTNPKNAAIIAAIGAFVAVCKTWDTLAANEKWKIICGKIKKFIEILEDLGGHILLGITFIIFIMVYTICNDAVFMNIWRLRCQSAEKSSKNLLLIGVIYFEPEECRNWMIFNFGKLLKTMRYALEAVLQ